MQKIKNKTRKEQLRKKKEQTRQSKMFTHNLKKKADAQALEINTSVDKEIDDLIDKKHKLQAVVGMLQNKASVKFKQRFKWFITGSL